MTEASGRGAPSPVCPPAASHRGVVLLNLAATIMHDTHIKEGLPIPGLPPPPLTAVSFSSNLAATSMHDTPSSCSRPRTTVMRERALRVVVGEGGEGEAAGSGYRSRDTRKKKKLR